MHSFTSKAKSNKKRRRALVSDANFTVIDLIHSAYGALYELKSITRTSDVAIRDFLHIY